MTAFSCVSREPRREAFAFSYCAIADFQANSALSAFWLRSGLLNSRMTLSGLTVAPGRNNSASTRPEVVEVSHRMSSGTSVPEPWTFRIIWPRLTGSIHGTPAGTSGAAGLRRETATDTPPRTTTPSPIQMARLIFFWRKIAGSRLTSIAITVILYLNVNGQYDDLP